MQQWPKKYDSREKALLYNVALFHVQKSTTTMSCEPNFVVLLVIHEQKSATTMSTEVGIIS